jgi:hypothetical protein
MLMIHERVAMGFDQYHEPPAELPAETRTFARMCANLIEEVEAISWYTQRMSIEPNPDSRAIMNNALGEEYKHFSMDLEFLLRSTPQWRKTARGIVFQDGDIVENGERAEFAADQGGEADDASAATGSRKSLGIGSLKGHPSRW